jgi:hypothetical protein
MPMMMVVVTMAKNAVAMAVADSVMAMSAMTAVVTVAAMPAVATACESLAGDGQGSAGQRESGNRRGNDRLELRHGRLLGLGRAGIALR